MQEVEEPHADRALFIHLRVYDAVHNSHFKLLDSSSLYVKQFVGMCNIDMHASPCQVLEDI